ncbi:MAG: hypothetical protein WKG07_20730 [Hymenobacter sp.]
MQAASGAAGPRLFAQAAATDVVGAFPTQEFDWLRAAGLAHGAGRRRWAAPGCEPQPPRSELLTRAAPRRARQPGGGSALRRPHQRLVAHAVVGTPAQAARYAADAAAPADCLACGTPKTRPTACSWRPLPDGRYRLHGAKTFASGAGPRQRGRSSRAPCPTGRGWQLLVLPADAAAAGAGPLVLAAAGDAGHRQLPRRLDRPGNWARRPAAASPTTTTGSPGLGAGPVGLRPCSWAAPRPCSTKPAAFCAAWAAPTTPTSASAWAKWPCSCESGRQWLRGAAAHAVLPDAAGAAPPVPRPPWPTPTLRAPPSSNVACARAAAGRALRGRPRPAPARALRAPAPRPDPLPAPARPRLLCWPMPAASCWKATIYINDYAAFC